jgi:hypothetical protein
MKQFKLLLLGLLVFAFIACDTEEIAKTTTDLLTQKVWTFDVAVGNADQAVIIDLLNTEWAGLTLDFKTDGTYTVVSYNDTDTGVWVIENDNLVLDKGTTDQQSFFIYSITETEMRLQMEIGTSNTFSVYFK